MAVDDPVVIKCKYCDETWEGIKRDQLKLYRERNRHTKAKHETAVKEEKTLAGLPSGAITERAKMFAEALDSVAPNMGDKQRQTLIQAYERDAEFIGEDPRRLENLLMEWGLHWGQMRQMVRVMFPRSMYQGQQAHGEQPAYAVNPTTGQYVPLTIQQPSAPGQPPVFILPNQPQPSAMPSLSPYEIEAMIDRRLDEKLDRLADKLQGPHQPQAVVPVRRIPIIGEDGNAMRDADGRPLYQEVPYDPMMNMFEMIRPLIFARPKELDEEKLIRGIKDAVTPQPAASEEQARLVMDNIVHQATERLRTELQSKDEVLKALQDSINRMSREREIEDAVRTAIKEHVGPIQAALESDAYRKGLTDAQANLVHKETMAAMSQDVMTRLADGARSDLRPLIMQISLSQLKAMGVTDEVLGQIARSSMSGPAQTSGPMSDKINAIRQKYLKGGSDL